MNDLRGPDWRANPTGTTARRGPNPVFALVGVCVLATVGLSLLVWVRPVRPAAVVCVSVSAFADGTPVPFASADFAHITADPLRPAAFALPPDPTRDQLRTALAAVAAHPADQPLVVFLTGAAAVSDGQVVLSAGVPGADHGRNRVTLAEVLERVRAAPTPHKLVVLDLVAGEADWVPFAVKSLENVPDAHRLVLFARGAGERSYASEVRRGAVFVRYWADGLGGAADANADSRVSVSELAAFVRSRTVQWAELNRDTSQTPWLTGDGADFTLCASSTPVIVEPEPPADPSKLLEAWAVQEAWLADGRADRAPAAFAELHHALLRMDRDWQAGKSPDEARRAFDLELPRIEAAVPAADVPESLLPLPTPDPAAVEALRRFLLRPEVQPPEKAPPAAPPVVLAVASADPPPTAAQLKRLAALLTEVEPEPAGWPSLLLKRMVAEAVSPDRAARLLRNTLEFEHLSRRVEFFAWGGAGLERACTQWSAALAFTCSPTHASAADAERTLTELEATLRTLGFAAEVHRAATATLRRGERVLVNTAELRAALTPPPSPTLATTAAAANVWGTLAAEVEAAVRTQAAPYQPAELAALRRKAARPDAGPRELNELDRALAFPLLPSKDRGELWQTRFALMTRLEDATAQQPPAWADPRQVPPPRPLPSVPAPSPTPAVFESPRGAFLAWHAGRFEYLSHNPLDLPNAVGEVTVAARSLDQCRRQGATPLPLPRLEIQADGVDLTPAKRSADVTVSVRLIGPDAPPTAVEVLSPAAEWVTAPPADPVTLSPVRAVVAKRTLTVGSHPEKHPSLAGALVRADAGGRPFFKRVAVNTAALSNSLELLVSADPKAPPAAATSLRVRPNGRAATFTLLVSNPTPVPQSVIVQLENPPRETAPLTIPAGQSLPIIFPPPAAPAPAPATPAPEFTPAPAEFVLHLLDAKTRKPRQTFTVPVRVTEPAELLDVREVVYSPAGELKATIGERSVFGGGDMPVSLTFPEGRNSGLSVADGKLSGTLVPGQGELVLYAKRLKFEPAAGRVVTLAVTADGVERAFTFVGEATGDAAVRFQPLAEPRVQIRCEPFATGTAPFPVKLEADNAPPSATVEVAVGTETGGKFAADFTRRDIPARDRGAGVAFDPKGGWTLKATVADPQPKLPVDQLVGTRVLLARLLDANGKELARNRREVTFDGRRPQGVRFLDPPAKVPADKPLSLKAASDLPVSGVKEVHLFVGKPANDAPPPNAVLIEAKPADGRTEWAAAVPLDGTKGPLDVSVRVTSKAGLVGFATVTIERVDAADLNKPEPATVRGKLLEGTLAQPGLTVTLLDDKGKENAKAKTKDDGSFAFPDLAAGKYTLFAEKPSTGREKRLPVEVKAGEEKVVELGLLLK